MWGGAVYIGSVSKGCVFPLCKSRITAKGYTQILQNAPIYPKNISKFLQKYKNMYNKNNILFFPHLKSRH